MLTETEKREKKIKDNKSVQPRQQRSEEQIFLPEFKEKANI